MTFNRLTVSISLLLMAQAASANPTGAQVIHGSASFSNPSVNVLNVTNSHNAVINWQSFNIGKDQTTNFIQPSSASAVLNRVLSTSPSQILGNLNSNGSVYLINQHGILVGEGASINTGGFFASTLNITDSDFLSGQLRFEGGGLGDIQNLGYIHAGDDGHIVLIAPNIENGGVIEVDNGNIILAAGQSITITSLQNTAIQYEVSASDNQVTNLGQLIAHHGAASLFAGSLKHSGAIRAGGLVRDNDGSVRLVAAGSNEVSGSINAGGEQGGYVEILGDHINVEDGALVNASGISGGGEILIGGDRQGLNPDIRNATSTTIAAGAEVHADAIQSGKGGKVIVFAESDVHVHGEVTARGGADGGDGGFIETSGLQWLDITAIPDASASVGTAGEWLIDPFDITIVPGVGANDPADYLSAYSSAVDGTILGATLISSALSAGTSVVITTGAGGTGQGDITLLAGAGAPLVIQNTGSVNASLTLNAHNNINFTTSSSSSISISSTNAQMDIILNADSDGLNGGQVFFDTGTGNSFPITIDTNGGNLLTNNDVTVSGENTVSIFNTDWDLSSHLFIDFSSTLALTQASGGPFVIPVGGMLSGNDGTLVSDVDVNGGVLVGGALNDPFSLLTITGNLQMNSGLLFTTVDPVEGFSAGSIQANTIAINGGDILMSWWDSFSLESSPTPPYTTSILTCAVSDCISGSFDTVIEPIGVTSSLLEIEPTNTDSLVYTINSLDTGVTITAWSGAVSNDWSVAGNWTNGVPTATSYAFLNDPSDTVNLSSSVSVAGLQSVGSIRLLSGAGLTLNGDGFILSTDTASGSLGLAATDAQIGGNGVLYIGPASQFGVNQGILTSDAVNWGELLVAANSAFQLDANLVNQTSITLADAGDINWSGSGSITQNAYFDWGDTTRLSLDGLSLSVGSDNARFTGTGVLALTGNAVFDAGINAAETKDLSSLQTLNINGSSLLNAQDMILPSTVNIGNGGLLSGNGTLSLAAGSQVIVAGGIFAGVDSANLLSVDNAGSIDVVASQTLSLINAVLSNSGSGSLSGAGGVQVSNGGQLSADSLVDIARIQLVNGGTLIANNFTFAGNLDWQDGTVTGSGEGLTTTGQVDLLTGSLTDANWTVASTGSVLWQGTDRDGFVINNAILTNLGEFTVSSAVDGSVADKLLSSPASDGQFINENLLLIDANEDSVVFDLVFDNQGTLGIESGSFGLAGNDLVLAQAGANLQGFGTFVGNVINSAGVVSPGRTDIANNVFQTGTLTIDGNYTQGANGTLVIELDSTLSGLLHDTLDVSGQLNADGLINFSIINNRTISEIALLIDQSFRPLRYGSFVGRFSDVRIPQGLNFSLSDNGLISISSNSDLLNQLSNELEVLLSARNLSYGDMVSALKYLERQARFFFNDNDDEERRSPRLVCK